MVRAEQSDRLSSLCKVGVSNFAEGVDCHPEADLEFALNPTRGVRPRCDESSSNARAKRQHVEQGNDTG